MSDLDATALATSAPELSSPAAIRIPLLEPLSAVLWCVLGLAAIALIAAASLTGFTVRGIPSALVLFLMLVVGGLVFRRRGRLGAGALLEGLAQFTLTGILLGLLALVLATTNLPYRDAELAALDQILFPVDWLRTSAALTSGKAAALVLNVAYGAIGWLPFVLIFALVATGKLQRLRIFLLAWALSLAVVIAIFPFVPAVGYYLHYGVPQTDMPGVYVAVAWRHLEILQPLRDGALRGVHFASYAGIVTFPSFHAAAAVVLAWGFYGVPVLRWPGIIVNVLMLVSSMPVGAHYIIDLVAGMIIAFGALIVVKHLAGRVRGPADRDMEFWPWLREAAPFLPVPESRYSRRTVGVPGR
jgi:membrane-associated phospholipid phosphatase